MEITALGHAGLLVSGDETTGLIDPWFARTGAFLGARHQLPANEHLVTPRVLKPDWVALTSARADRCDLSTLAQIPAGTPVIVPSWASIRLVASLRAHTALTIVETPAWVRIVLDTRGSWLTFLGGTAPPHDAAAVLLTVDGTTLLDAGDAALTTAHARDAGTATGGSVDVMAVHASEVPWRPLCHDARDDMIEASFAAHRSAQLRAIRSLVRVVEPGLVLPIGGPPCFLDPSLAWLNRWIVRPGEPTDPGDAAGWLGAHLPGQRVHAAQPGDRIVPRDGLWLSDEHAADVRTAASPAALREYAHTRAVDLSRVHAMYPDPAEAIGDRLSEHLARLAERHPRLADTVGMPVRFDVQGAHGGSWDVVWEAGAAHVERGASRAAVPCVLHVASRWLAPVLDGAIGWDELLFSLRYSLSSDDSVSDDRFLDLLRYADSPTHAADPRPFQGTRILVHRTLDEEPLELEDRELRQS